jgi:hypothetical protein
MPRHLSVMPNEGESEEDFVRRVTDEMNKHFGGGEAAAPAPAETETPPAPEPTDEPAAPVTPEETEPA